MPLTSSLYWQCLFTRDCVQYYDNHQYTLSSVWLPRDFIFHLQLKVLKVLTARIKPIIGCLGQSTVLSTGQDLGSEFGSPKHWEGWAKLKGLLFPLSPKQIWAQMVSLGNCMSHMREQMADVSAQWPLQYINLTSPLTKWQHFYAREGLDIGLLRCFAII